MREWRKPTVEETESGMEVTSYLPAELDALNPSLLILGNRNGDPADSGVAVSLLRIAWHTLGCGKLSAKASRSDFLNLVSRQISSKRHAPLIQTPHAKIGPNSGHERHRGSS